MSNASPIPRRRVTLIRHAKAAEDNGMLPDAQRPLNARGQRDAQRLGEWLRAHPPYPELFLCSTAQRTRQTWAAFHSDAAVVFSARLYLATATEIFKIMAEADDALHHLAIIGHNPGLHQLAALLVGDYADPGDEDRLALKFPTAAGAIFSLPIAHWRALAPHTATLESFVTLER